MAGSRLKASDKKVICKKLVTSFKKRYGGSVPKDNRDVLHSLLFAICLEDNSYNDAVKIFEHMLESFHDLNEIRVSSITELESVFEEVHESEWKALRVRSLLQYIFEENFQFEYEGIRRKTFEQAYKQLAKIKDISPFILLQSLQSVLGSHVVPVDQTMIDCLVWMGLVDAGSDGASASDQMKSCVAKPEVPLFCHLLRSFAMEPKCRDLVREDLQLIGEREFDATSCVDRINDIFNSIDNRRVRKLAVTAEVVETGNSQKKSKSSTASSAPKTKSSSKSAGKKAASPASRKKTASKSPVKKTTASKAKKKSTSSKAVKKKTKSKKR